MTVVERSKDQFPIGMRVLAVDDDPTCLKLLEHLLRRCQYHVTTTNQAIVALKMLRERKNDFDLVISDVHMPDLDGFKLLELVGLEMDLPVIMLSANGEIQAVMKGISHGAVDYLLKPVRIEELRNIWQHVIRRRKVDSRDKNNLDSGDDCDKVPNASCEGEQGSITNGVSNRNEKLSKKRKDQNEDGDDDEDTEAENDDPSAQKKPRVVWSVELHRKFVAAVNQLGIDKAVPKRILDLMNVERLTRENVASHLQKYRLYLKRISAVANQQANMVAALRGRDQSSYLPMGSLDAYASFNALVGTRPVPGRKSFQPNASLPRMNASLPRMNNLTGFGIHGFSPSGSGQLGRTLAPSNTVSDITKHQGISQHGILLQEMQQYKAVQEASNRLVGGFSGNNSFTSIAKSPLALQANPSGFTNQSLSADPFDILADLGRCNQTWQSATMSVPFGQSDPSSSNIHDNIPSSSVVMAPMIDPVMRSLPSSLIMKSDTNGGDKLLNFGSLGGKQAHVHQNSSLMYNSLTTASSSLHAIGGGSNRPVGNQTFDAPTNRQPSFGVPLIVQDPKTVGADNGVGGCGHFSHKADPLSEEMNSHSGFGSSGCSLDDLVSSMIKPEHGDDFSFVDGEMGCNDIFSLGACM